MGPLCNVRPAYRHDISVPIDPFDDVDAGGDAGPTGTVQIAFNRLSVGAKAAPASASASASAAEQKEFQGLFDSDFNPLQRKEKLWTMTTRQIKELWDGIDANHDQEISLSEIIKFCKSFFARKVRDSAVDMNMQEAECKAFYLKGKPLTKHLVSLAKEMDRTMDVNQDGQIQKREFILRWNAMSQEYFGQQDSCSIM